MNEKFKKKYLKYKKIIIDREGFYRNDLMLFGISSSVVWLFVTTLSLQLLQVVFRFD